MAKEKVIPQTFSFYGGKAIIEKKPWGAHYSHRRQGEKKTLISVTGITKKLDKSGALIPWAVGLVCTEITAKVEIGGAERQYSKDEVMAMVEEARRAPETAKVSGGTTGTFIHDFAEAFAKAKIAGTELPTLDHLNPEIEEQQKALNGINAFLDWNLENEVEYLEMEKMFYYNSFLAGDTKEGEELIEYFGYADLVARVNGRLAMIDYKSSKGIYSEQKYQLRGYSHARDKEILAVGVADTIGLTDCDMVVNFNKLTGELMTEIVEQEDRDKNLKAFLGLYQVAVREKELGAY
jgi:hypothetical protein